MLRVLRIELSSFPRSCNTPSSSTRAQLGEPHLTLADMDVMRQTERATNRFLTSFKAEESNNEPKNNRRPLSMLRFAHIVRNACPGCSGVTTAQAPGIAKTMEWNRRHTLVSCRARYVEFEPPISDSSLS